MDQERISILIARKIAKGATVPKLQATCSTKFAYTEEPKETDTSSFVDKKEISSGVRFCKVAGQGAL
jgi:hypothetical protein